MSRFRVKREKSVVRSALLCTALLLLVSCAALEEQVLRLGTTTSTYDSGLLDEILPTFEAEHGVRVDVIAVGTGQALALGKRGDADVILVHAESKEQAFVDEGYGLARLPVMLNDFILVGPSDDPAKIAGVARAAAALGRIAGAGAPFASRGDDSGTHSRERALWQAAGLVPDTEAGWYLSLGQGMAATLQLADQVGAYTLTDRGTFMAQRAQLQELEVMVGGHSITENLDPALMNPYSIIPVNPARSDGIQADVAQNFIDWLLSLETQERIAVFGVKQYGQPLFFPDSERWRSSRP